MGLYEDQKVSVFVKNWHSNDAESIYTLSGFWSITGVDLQE